MLTVYQETYKYHLAIRIFAESSSSTLLTLLKEALAIQAPADMLDLDIALNQLLQSPKIMIFIRNMICSKKSQIDQIREVLSAAGASKIAMLWTDSLIDPCKNQCKHQSLPIYSPTNST
jgi:hypothetical protein